MEPLKRLDAARLGQFKYWTGKPCLRGHSTYRYTKTGTCADCVRYHAKQAKKSLLAGIHGQSVHITANVHPDDAQTVYEFIDAINAARALS